MTDIAPDGINAPMARYVHHLEYVCAILCGAGEKTGAQGVTGKLGRVAVWAVYVGGIQKANNFRAMDASNVWLSLQAASWRADSPPTGAVVQRWRVRR